MFKHCLFTLMLAGLSYTALPAAVAQDASTSDQQQSAPADNQQQAAAPVEKPGHHFGGDRFDPARRTEMLTKKLNLNTDQQAKVQDLMKSEQSEFQKIHDDSSLSRDARRSKMMEIHKSSNEQLRALLDNDQQKKWDEMQSRREQWMKRRVERQQQSAPAPASPEQK
jgi:hypothetical protein